MFENLSIVIVIIGITSLFVNFYYNRLLKKILTLLAKLLKLQDTRNDNIEEYIQAITENLKDIGVKHIFYDISYLGKHIYSSPGDSQAKTILKKEIFYKNIDGYLLMEVENNKGEYKIINKLILFVVTLQIVNAIHTDIERINESFAEIAKLQTYMMHDLKNILQFFQAMQYNVENIQTEEQKDKFIDFLQHSTQPINKKVNRILSLLRIRSNLNPTVKKKEIHLRPVLQEYVKQYFLQCQISGDAKIQSDEEALMTIFENVLGNIHYKAATDPTLRCQIKITETATAVQVKIQDDGAKFENPKSVMRPFYTTKEDGLGIGMYQAQTLVEHIGGVIECKNEDEKATVTIRLPKM